MDVPMVDYTALLFALLKWVLAILSFLILIAIVVRLSGVLNLTVCPSCGEKLKRAKRKSQDKRVRLLALGLLPIKRYRCYACYWDGIGFRVFDKEKTIEGQNLD
jgi:uncharacterized protein with PIN domain